MSPGSIAQILVKKGEAIENIPKSIEEEGHIVLKKTEQKNNNCLLLIRKNKG